MKYLLKQNKEDKGILCDKVTIDGFDYYVSDNPKSRDYCLNLKTNEFFRVPDNSYVEGLNKNSEDKKVIATSDPNIDLPQVVDDVAETAYNWLYEEETENKASQGYPLKPMQYGFIKGYNKSQEIHPNSDEDMDSFAEFTSLCGWCFNNNGNYWFNDDNNVNHVSTKELRGIWKSQQLKIVYYE